MPSIDVNPERYTAQLDTKIDTLRSMFEKFEMPPLEVFTSPPVHYRMRAEFRVWHDDDDLYYIMFNAETKAQYRVDQFPAASRIINDVMPVLMQKIRVHPCLRRRLFQVDFLSTLSGELVISLLYHRPLDDEWTAAARALKTDLAAAGFTLDLIGRARKLKIAIDRDYVVERLQVDGETYTYQQYENSFTQPNAVVAQKMLTWATECTVNGRGDLLELYCGNGNFSLALAKNFTRVLATELAKSSVKAAHYNIDANGITNVQIARLSAEEVTQAIDGVRAFRRLRDAGIDLNDYNFETILVDPPRAGMDEKSCAMVQRFDNVVYISCNPATLRDNLDALYSTHAVARFALFDQFPYTDHIEAGVLLKRR